MPNDEQLSDAEASSTAGSYDFDMDESGRSKDAIISIDPRNPELD